MSKYTTELRYICETFAGLTESVGFNDVEQVIKNSLPKIFDFDFPIFDEAYRTVIETKILRHYYTREIGLETAGLWKLKLCTRLNEIMPLYNQFYKSELIKFNPLYDVDLTRERKTERAGKQDIENGENRSGNISTETAQNSDNNVSENGSEKVNLTSTINATQNQNSTGANTNMYSDTPQGAITDLQSGKYLTNATIDNSTNSFASANNESTIQNSENTRNNSSDTSGSSEGKSETDSSSKMSGFSNTTLSNTEDYLETVVGSTGGESFAKRLLDFRSTFINIDMMVIEELNDLFMNLW